MFLVEVYLVGDYTEPKHKDRFRVQPPPRTTLHYPRTPVKGYQIMVGGVHDRVLS